MRAWVSAVLGLAVLLAAGAFLRETRARRLERAAREQVAVIGVLPLDEDEAQELVRAYAAPAAGAEGLVEAIDLQTGEPRWRGSAPIEPGTRRPEIGWTEGTIAMAGEGKGGPWVIALDAATGAERWRWRAPEGWALSPYSPLIPAPEAIVVSLASRETGRAALVGLSPESGAVRWERQHEGPPWEPQGASVERLLFSAGERALVLDPATGGAAEIPAVGPGAWLGERWLIPQQREGGYVVAAVDPETGDADLLRLGGQVLRLPLHVDPRRGLAGAVLPDLRSGSTSPPLADQRLIALVSPDHRLWRAQGLVSISLADGTQERRPLPAGYFPAMDPDPGRVDPGSSPFRSLRSRYLPLVLLAESGADAKLVVWDLAGGGITWQSEPLEYGVLPSVLQWERGFILSIPVGDGERALLGLDGATGRFTAAARVVLAQDGGETSVAPAALEAWMAGRDHLLGAWGGASWALRWGDLSPAYRSAKVVVEPAWEEAEALLGPLPR